MNRREEQLQRALVAYLRASLPKPWLVWATPNGGGRSKAEAGALKAAGVLAGVPDLFVCGHYSDPYPWTGVRTRLIAIELKAPPRPLKSGRLSKAAPKPSPAQAEVIAQLEACGVPTIVTNDLDDAIAKLRSLGVPLKGRAMA